MLFIYFAPTLPQQELKKKIKKILKNNNKKKEVFLLRLPHFCCSSLAGGKPDSLEEEKVSRCFLAKPQDLFAPPAQPGAGSSQCQLLCNNHPAGLAQGAPREIHTPPAAGTARGGFGDSRDPTLSLPGSLCPQPGQEGRLDLFCHSWAAPATLSLSLSPPWGHCSSPITKFISPSSNPIQTPLVSPCPCVQPGDTAGVP